MNEKELEFVLQEGEGLKIEFKEKFSDEIIESLNKNNTEEIETAQKSSQKILELIKKNNKITIEELASSLKITDRGVKKNLAKLKKEGILKRIGPDKGGYWEIRRWK